jgi:hypothetical protein
MAAISIVKEACKLAPAVAKLFSVLFTLIMSADSMPADWTRTIVTPVDKNRNASHMFNYRPILQPSVDCKRLEKIISLDMLNFCVAAR